MSEQDLQVLDLDLNSNHSSGQGKAAISPTLSTTSLTSIQLPPSTHRNPNTVHARDVDRDSNDNTVDDANLRDLVKFDTVHHPSKDTNDTTPQRQQHPDFDHRASTHRPLSVRKRAETIRRHRRSSAGRRHRCPDANDVDVADDDIDADHNDDSQPPRGGYLSASTTIVLLLLLMATVFVVGFVVVTTLEFRTTSRHFQTTVESLARSSAGTVRNLLDEGQQFASGSITSLRFGLSSSAVRAQLAVDVATNSTPALLAAWAAFEETRIARTWLALTAAGSTGTAFDTPTNEGYCTNLPSSVTSSIIFTNSPDAPLTLGDGGGVRAAATLAGRCHFVSAEARALSIVNHSYPSLSLTQTTHQLVAAASQSVQVQNSSSVQDSLLEQTVRVASAAATYTQETALGLSVTKMGISIAQKQYITRVGSSGLEVIASSSFALERALANIELPPVGFACLVNLTLLPDILCTTQIQHQHGGQNVPHIGTWVEFEASGNSSTLFTLNDDGLVTVQKMLAAATLQNFTDFPVTSESKLYGLNIYALALTPLAKGSGTDIVYVLSGAFEDEETLISRQIQIFVAVVILIMSFLMTAISGSSFYRLFGRPLSDIRHRMQRVAELDVDGALSADPSLPEDHPDRRELNEQEEEKAQELPTAALTEVQELYDAFEVVSETVRIAIPFLPRLQLEGDSFDVAENPLAGPGRAFSPKATRNPAFDAFGASHMSSSSSEGSGTESNVSDLSSISDIDLSGQQNRLSESAHSGSGSSGSKTFGAGSSFRMTASGPFGDTLGSNQSGSNQAHKERRSSHVGVSPVPITRNNSGLLSSTVGANGGGGGRCSRRGTVLALEAGGGAPHQGGSGKNQSFAPQRSMMIRRKDHSSYANDTVNQQRCVVAVYQLYLRARARSSQTTVDDIVREFVIRASQIPSEQGGQVVDVRSTTVTVLYMRSGSEVKACSAALDFSKQMKTLQHERAYFSDAFRVSVGVANGSASRGILGTNVKKGFVCEGVAVNRASIFAHVGIRTYASVVISKAVAEVTNTVVASRPIDEVELPRSIGFLTKGAGDNNANEPGSGGDEFSGGETSMSMTSSLSTPVHAAVVMASPSSQKHLKNDATMAKTASEELAAPSHLHTHIVETVYQALQINKDDPNEDLEWMYRVARQAALNDDAKSTYQSAYAHFIAGELVDARIGFERALLQAREGRIFDQYVTNKCKILANIVIPECRLSEAAPAELVHLALEASEVQVSGDNGESSLKKRHKHKHAREGFVAKPTLQIYFEQLAAQGKSYCRKASLLGADGFPFE